MLHHMHTPCTQNGTFCSFLVAQVAKDGSWSAVHSGKVKQTHCDSLYHMYLSGASMTSLHRCSSLTSDRIQCNPHEVTFVTDYVFAAWGHRQSNDDGKCELAYVCRECEFIILTRNLILNNNGVAQLKNKVIAPQSTSVSFSRVVTKNKSRVCVYNGWLNYVLEAYLTSSKKD